MRNTTQRSSILCGIFFLPMLIIGVCVGAPAKQYDLTTFLAPDSINDATQQDTDVAALEHLKHQHSTTHQTKDETLPALEKQLESQTELNLPHNVDVHDVENPVNEKPTTVTSHIKSETVHLDHERPNSPPFDESSNMNEHEDDDQKPTPKAYSGAARLLTCSTCGANSPDDKPHVHATEKRIKLNMNRNTIQNAESLFKHNGGQYSANDLAQYIFWTGDEAGVARAIEDLIDAGLLSREAALMLLKEIRMTTDELQETYAKYDVTSARYNSREEVETSPTTSSRQTGASSTLSPAVLKTLASIPNLLKLEGAAKNDVYYDESSGRLRLADFLYAEYTLEQIIYNLAKVMFTQSLNQGSEDAQVALEKLTAFLDSEGQQGRISPALQKKILDVLLAALSDVLHDTPELMTAAKHALGSYLSQLPVHHEYKN